MGEDKLIKSKIIPFKGKTIRNFVPWIILILLTGILAIVYSSISRKIFNDDINH